MARDLRRATENILKILEHGNTLLYVHVSSICFRVSTVHTIV